MKKIFLLPLALVMMITFSQCSKEESSTGQAGEQGPQGPQGEIGMVGPAGDHGSMMYANDGEPLAEQGVAGDFYLDSSTGELYGPKSLDGWGEPTIVLMGQNGKNGEDGKDGSNGINGEDGKDGADGTNGANGSTIYAGELDFPIIKGRVSLPNPKIGKDGDYFLDQTNYNLFGPKTNGSWGTNPINLKGPKGDDGADGIDGTDGNDGVDGADGNANITQYVFGEFLVQNMSNVFTIPVDKSIIDKSAIHVYVKRASTWVPIPSKEFGQIFINGYTGTTNVFISEAGEAVGYQYTGLRIIVAEAETTVIINARTMPDFNDYQAVADHYGLLR